MSSRNGLRTSTSTFAPDGFHPLAASPCWWMEVRLSGSRAQVIHNLATGTSKILTPLAENIDGAAKGTKKVQLVGGI